MVANIFAIKEARSMSPNIGLTSQIITLVAELIKHSSNISDKDSIQETTDKATKQNISLELVQQQARVAQELAIALRIETANDVEIEEFYDTTGKGNAGLNRDKGSISLGINGAGRKITKRIYKFKGHNGKKSEIYEQKLNDILSPDK
ncbi:hypothetical protein [Clostridium tyrobutyricum]|uniref:hypothetical protein n=1 Tax=Clostridium tyrobutyricum TaxID=1519 RepID=UPI00189F71E7|nr:hypothetical protein [Clostridium tyrobutyricum]